VGKLGLGLLRAGALGRHALPQSFDLPLIGANTPGVYNIVGPV
jgi:hypothetical protein